jgi:hypothetical protein
MSYAAGAVLCAAGLDCVSDVGHNYDAFAARCASGSLAYNAIRQGEVGNTKSAWETVERRARAAQCRLLRDIFRKPSRRFPSQPSVARALRDSTVPRIAQTIYNDRRFQDLPILADALEEAGCTDSEILGHCRGPGEHARGCWVLDLILGKG